MATGTVKWFENAKAYGFIRPDAGGRDVFVHFADIIMDGFKTLTVGQPVSYDVEQMPRGPQARKVVPIGPAPYSTTVER